MNYTEYLEVALEIAKKNAPLFKKGFFEKNSTEWKSESDPVTVFDKKIEEETRNFILAKYPDHLVLGEEDGLGENTGSDFEWIIDPIDGTVNYIRGVAFMAYSLALSYKGEIVVAVVANPVLDEYFWAAKGEGAYLNGEKISVSSCEDFKKSYLALGRYTEDYVTEYHTIIKTFQAVRNPGSAALALAYVACGRMEGVLYFNLSPWDMAGGVLLVEEAGGIVTNINSDKFSLKKASILGGNPHTYHATSSILSSLPELP